MNITRHIRLTAVAVLAFSLGLHWVVLQSVAWVNMAVQFSQELPLVTALQKTFDRQHACQLCHVVAAGKKSQQEQDDQSLPFQLEAVLNPVATLRVPQAMDWQSLFLTQEALDSETSAPRPPPPRFIS